MNKCILSYLSNWSMAKILVLCLMLGLFLTSCNSEAVVTQVSNTTKSTSTSTPIITPVAISSKTVENIPTSPSLKALSTNTPTTTPIAISSETVQKILTPPSSKDASPPLIVTVGVLPSDQPTPDESQPTPIPIDTFHLGGDLDYLGTGNFTSEVFSLEEGVTVFNLGIGGDGKNIMQLLDNSYNVVATIVDKVGMVPPDDDSSSDPSVNVPVEIPVSGKYRIKVITTGDWGVIFKNYQYRIGYITPPTVQNLSGVRPGISRPYSLKAGLVRFKVDAQDFGAGITVNLLDRHGKSIVQIADITGSEPSSKLFEVRTNDDFFFEILSKSKWGVKPRWNITIYQSIPSPI